MNIKYVSILIITTLSLTMYGQNSDIVIEGKVSFITSKNVYVKFDKTDLIKIGDTLKTSNRTPCLLVTNKSSSSVVCILINDCNVQKEDLITFVYIAGNEPVIEQEAVVEDIGISYNDSIKAIEERPKEKEYIEKIKSRLSASSYSTFSNIRDDNHRIVSRFSLNAYHINHSKYSLETYLNYRKNISVSNTDANALRVFNLAVRYDVDSTMSITLGRKINYKISSLGAIDGLQAEKFFGKNYVGVIAGFRPDIFDFGFNSNLLQYGTYIGRLTNSDKIRAQTTLGIAEQRNKSDLDRRFTYLQHSSTLFNKLNLYAVSELDIYNKANDSIKNSPRLTNLYLSARYRFSRKVSLALSYDSRKRIIYYKTYETDLEQILDEDIARQGIRARLNIKPFKYVFTGFSYSKRFQSDNQNKSDNMYGYVSFSRLPKISGRISLTYNRNSSNYLDSNIGSLRYSRTFFEDRLNADFYYRFVDYKYKSTVTDFNQHYIGMYLSYYIDRSLILSVSGEYSTYDLEHSYRLNTRIIKRFYRQRKK